MKRLKTLLLAITAGILTTTASAESHDYSWKTRKHDSHRYESNYRTEYNIEHKHCRRAPKTITKRIWVPESTEYKTEKIWVSNWVEEVTVTKRKKHYKHNWKRHYRNNHSRRINREVRLVDKGHYEYKQFPVTRPGYWKEVTVETKRRGRCVSHKPRQTHQRHEENSVTYTRTLGQSIFSIILDL